MSEYSIKQGDLLPKIQATLRDADGVPLDLTGCTVTFRMREKGLTSGETLKIADADADIVGDPTEGTVEYAWQLGDTDTPGYYAGEWVVLNGSSEPMTTPTQGYIFVRIDPNLLEA